MTLATLEEEEFLSYILKSFFREEKSYIHELINFDAITQAVTFFINHFDNEDRANGTNHSEIIKKGFMDDLITTKNCGAEIGISRKTFCRYKQKYLQVFRSYLQQCLGVDQLPITQMKPSC